MNVTTMRRMDRWVGVPLCLLLTWVRRIADGWRRLGRQSGAAASGAWDDVMSGKTRRPSRPPAVLLVKLAEMGSTVLAVPALLRLLELAPGVRLHYLCFDENEPVLTLIPGVAWEAVHTIRTSSPWALIADSLRVLARLRRLRLDAAIDLEIFSRASAALIYASGARTRVGFHRFHAEGMNCGDLFTHRLTYNSQFHTAGAFLALVEALAAPPGEIPLLKKKLTPPARLPTFQPTDVQREAVWAKLRERGVPADGSAMLVILNANTGDLLPLRRWPAPRFIDLARRCLAYDENLWIVLTGAGGEAPAIEDIARRIGHRRVVSLAGQTSLVELVTLYTLARVLITNDSGPAHFAALTPVRVISMFGPETPNLYRPLSERAECITAGLACSPCIHVFNARHTPCTDNLCMQAISVNEVFAAFERAYRPGKNVRSERTGVANRHTK